MRADRSEVFGLDLNPVGEWQRRAFRLARPHVERLLGLTWMEKRYATRPRDCSATDFLSWSLGVLDPLFPPQRSSEEELGSDLGAAVPRADREIVGLLNGFPKHLLANPVVEQKAL